MAVSAFLYNFGFFILLAYSPFVLDLDEHGLGYVFFGWGLLLAITSVFTAPLVHKALGTVRSLVVLFIAFAAILVIMGIWTDHQTLIITCIVVAGAVLGMVNTLMTTAVMGSAPVERSIASSAYSSVRFIGGALAPWIAGMLSEHFTASTPYTVGGIVVFVGMLVLLMGRKHLAGIKVNNERHCAYAVSFFNRGISPLLPYYSNFRQKAISPFLKFLLLQILSFVSRTFSEIFLISLASASVRH